MELVLGAWSLEMGLLGAEALSSPEEEVPEAGAVCLQGSVRPVLRLWKDSKLEPPALLEPAAAAKVKNVAGAMLIEQQANKGESLSPLLQPSSFLWHP